MLQRSVNKYDSIFIQANSTPVQLNNSNDPEKTLAMSTSAAAVGSNNTVVNSIAQELVCSNKIKIRLIKD